MSKTMCPGQDTRYWRPGDIFEVNCASCGTAVEFWKDESRRRCPRCGTRVQNPRLTMGCAQWCEHAKECLGYDPAGVVEMPEGEPGARAAVDAIYEAARRELAGRPEIASRARASLARARELLREGGADPRVVLAATALRPLIEGLGVYEGLEAAERILREQGLDAATSDRVRGILQGREDTAEARMVEEAICVRGHLAQAAGGGG